MYLSKKGLTFRILSATLIFSFAISFILPKNVLAGRSNAGGGEIAEFDAGKWVLGNAVGIASSAVGGAFASWITGAFSTTEGVTALGNLTESLSKLSELGSWVNNFAVNTAVGQVQYATGMLGQYSGWDPGSTILVSSILGGVTAGGLSPGHFGSSIGSMASGGAVTQTLGASIGALEGMGIGLIEGSLEGAILMSAADKKGRIEPWAGALAGLAGNLVTGSLVGGLSGPKGDEFSFANIGNFNLAGAAQGGLRTTLRSIPSAGLNIGVQSITKGMDQQDAYIIRNAFSGLYYPINAYTNYLVDDKIMKSLFKQPQANLITGNPARQFQQTLSSYPAIPKYNQPKWEDYKRYRDNTSR